MPGSESVRILLVNLHSAYNAGDDALMQEAMRQLGEQFPGAEFTLAMNDPASCPDPLHAVGSFTSWVKPISSDQARSQWRWTSFPGLFAQSLLALAGHRLTGRAWTPWLPKGRRALLQAYFQADLVISAAGNFLYSSGRLGLPFLLALYAMYYAHLAGKPFYTLPQTLGPIRRARERILAASVLSRARIVLIRDPISAEVCEAWKVPGLRWRMTPDLAFARSAEPDTKAARALLTAHGAAPAEDRPLLGVTVIQWGAQNRTFQQQSAYEEAVETAIRAFLAEHPGQAVLFSQVCGPTTAEDDRVAAMRLHGRLRDLGERVVLIRQGVPAAVLKAAYGQMDLFLGTRLHSNIFALTERVPVVAIGYQYKTRGIMRLLGLERWTMDIDQTRGPELAALLRRAWLEREATVAHLTGVLQPIRQQALQAGTLIAGDYHSLCHGHADG